MKKIIYITFICLSVFYFGCKKQLDVKNNNDPTLATANTEEGIKKVGMGVYGYFVTPEGNQEGGILSYNFLWFALTNHDIMGDVVYVPWGNFGWRWINRPAEITLDNGTKVHPPTGGTQTEEIARLNDRAKLDDNPVKHEWYAMYVINNTANLILTKLNTDAVTFKSNGGTKKGILYAWAYFWKAFAYSRIGSFYSAGLLTDVYSETNANYVTHDQMITEANAYYDKALAILDTISGGDAYNAFLGNLIPQMGRSNSEVPSPEAWTRNINTLKARNILVNKKTKDLTQAEWQSILTLTNTGLQPGDFEFVIIPDSRIVSTASMPSRVVIGWAFASERLIQDFKDTAVDTRFHRYFAKSAAPIVNQSGRGIQFGTRWDFVDGTDLATSVPGSSNDVQIRIAGSYEENELMRAEANIHLNNINDGLTNIDNVRDFQGAELPHVANTGLDQTQAKEELRKERRIGLMLRGLSFYDARRWGVTDPVATGGGRTGCWVLDSKGNLNTNATFDYQYLNYFPVPLNETDFNEPSSGSANVAAQ